MFKRFYEMFSNNIGIDLGTANTLVYLEGEGVIINEPSVVAVNQKTDRIVAIGNEAKQMLGRTPAHIKAIRPLVDGVISDFEVTEEMLTYFINKTEKKSKKMIRPRIVVGVPSGVTNVEIRAVYDATKNAGAREVFIVEQPMAAAIGIGLPVKDPVGSMVVDIGGGTTDIAVISFGGIVRSKSLKIAGDKLNSDIITYLRDEFKLLIGEKTAENVKIEISSVDKKSSMESSVRGRDLVTGLPREVIITDSDLREAISQSIENLVNGIKEVLETTPPEIVSDVMKKGLVLVGGGAMIQGLDTLLQNSLKIPVTIANEPLLSVVKGTGIILENLEYFKDVLINTHDDLPPR